MELDMGEKTTYLVMETHPAYVVLLDSEGRFLKAANCGYERGDRIDTAILIEYPQDKRRRRRRALRTAVSLAACVALAGAAGAVLLWRSGYNFTLLAAALWLAAAVRGRRKGLPTGGRTVTMGHND